MQHYKFRAITDWPIICILCPSWARTIVSGR